MQPAFQQSIQRAPAEIVRLARSVKQSLATLDVGKHIVWIVLLSVSSASWLACCGMAGVLFLVIGLGGSSGSPELEESVEESAQTSDYGVGYGGGYRSSADTGYKSSSTYLDPPSSEKRYTPPEPMTCFTCGGSGRQRCSYCNGSGSVIGGLSKGGPVYCTTCGGSGQRMCGGCGGRGKR